MYIQQIYTDCLSEASYFVSSNEEAAVIDPIRDPDFYLQIARDNNSVIKYIFETHFHADFISGHLELANKTHATIIFGPSTKANFTFHMAKDGEEFKIGIQNTRLNKYTIKSGQKEKKLSECLDLYESVISNDKSCCTNSCIVF